MTVAATTTVILAVAVILVIMVMCILSLKGELTIQQERCEAMITRLCETRDQRDSYHRKLADYEHQIKQARGASKEC